MTEKPSQRPRANRGGRPPFRPSLDDRRTVEEMKFCGESENVIARSLGIDVDTMRKHFVDELENGHANRRKEIIALMFQSARSGNVSAQKKLEEIGRAAGAAEAVSKRMPAAPKLGKKELGMEAARQVGGRYAVPASPKLVVDNGR